MVLYQQSIVISVYRSEAHHFIYEFYQKRRGMLYNQWQW